MKKIISLLLTFSLLLSCTAILSACSDNNENNIPENSDDTNSDSGSSSINTAIRIPEYKDYGRGTVNFSDLIYSTPNVSQLVTQFESACKMINEGSLPFEVQIEQLDALDSTYANFLSMYSLARINLQKDTSNEYWADEFKKLAANSAVLTKNIESLYVSAASSQYKKRFETEYFMTSLDGYVDGGKYTDRAVELLAEEATLEAEFASLSTASVYITYNDQTDTAERLLEKYSSGKFGEQTIIMEIYNNEVSKKSLEIYINLLKTRRELADELGYDSYTDIAYEERGHEYSADDMTDFLSSLKEDVAPVYYKLYNQIFGSYLSANLAKEQSYIKTVNTLYDVYGYTDSELSDIYSYMLQHGLFSIEPEGDNRFDGAFTTYIFSNNSPFLFASTDGNMTDYFTISHEFGHFADMYANDGESTSLDLMEVYSYAMQYLTLTKLKTKMSTENYKYLDYYAMHQAMSTLLYQGYIAAFEHLAYDLEYNDITQASLEQVANEAMNLIFGNIFDNSISPNIASLMIPHVIEYPFYVQSYCTSTCAALEIFFEEVNEAGRGFEIFKTLLHRNGEERSFLEHLEFAGISSPFDEGALRNISNSIHNYFLGTDYFSTTDNDLLNAA